MYVLNNNFNCIDGNGYGKLISDENIEAHELRLSNYSKRKLNDFYFYGKNWIN